MRRPASTSTSHHSPNHQSVISVRRFCEVSLLVIIWLFEQKVGGELFVLVTCEVCLDHLVAGKAKSAESFDRITLLLRNTNRGSTRWERTSITHATNGIASDVLASMLVHSVLQRLRVKPYLGQQLEKLFLILPNNLSKLWIAFSNLLEDRLEHGRLLLNKLTQLLEVRTLS